MINVARDKLDLLEGKEIASAYSVFDCEGFGKRIKQFSNGHARLQSS